MDVAHKSDVPRQSEAEQEAFFDAVLHRSVMAEARVGVVEHFFEVAETVVRIAFAGRSLAQHFVAALSHLEIVPTSDPDLTIHVWDSASTGVAMAAPPCSREAFTDRGDIWGMDSRRIRSAFHWIECSVNLMNVDTRTGIYWVQTADTLPYWTKASPLRTLFHWWMECNGCQLLHGAAVGDENGGILITGKGGVGKSTTALACLAAGLTYVSDDYLILRHDPSPCAFSLYSTAKINADQLDRFSQFRAMVANTPFLSDEKAVLYLYPKYARLIARSLPLKAAVTPRIAAQTQTEIAPASKISLQRAAAFTTMSQLPHAGRATHAFVDRLIMELPSLELVLGSALDHVPVAIADLLTWSRQRLVAISGGVPAARTDGPLVSVVIPVHNGARFLPEAIANILRQNYPSVEIIVVDDGSTDAIDAAVRDLPVDVRYFRQKNAGAAAARNRGIKDASGDIIAFLDVDDLWPENNLGLLVDTLLQNPHCDVVHGFAQLMHVSGGTGQFEYIGNPRESFPYYIGAGLYRRAAFQKVGLFDAELKFGEDTDWFARAKEAGLPIEKLEHVTLFVRRHDHNMTRGKSLVELNTLRVFKKTLDRKRAETPGVQCD
ncbi:MAG TPA: glycosyltransferase [Stellaceae bacterium]|nr:glycosyltransferase [Stellaceae bacterium]